MFIRSSTHRVTIEREVVKSLLKLNLDAFNLAMLHWAETNR